MKTEEENPTRRFVVYGMSYRGTVVPDDDLFSP